MAIAYVDDPINTQMIVERIYDKRKYTLDFQMMKKVNFWEK